MGAVIKTGIEKRAWWKKRKTEEKGKNVQVKYEEYFKKDGVPLYKIK